LDLIFTSPSFTEVLGLLPEDTGFETAFGSFTGVCADDGRVGVSGDSELKFVIVKVAITKIITKEAAKEYRTIF